MKKFNDVITNAVVLKIRSFWKTEELIIKVKEQKAEDISISKCIAKSKVNIKNIIKRNRIKRDVRSRKKILNKVKYYNREY